jgi:hypothetical protein
LAFIPDHFALQNIELHDQHESADINFTYLASTNPTHNSVEQAMVATLSMNIVAQSEGNGTTSNYNSQCYAQDMNEFKIGYMIDNATASNANPGVLTNILYRWYDDSSAINEEEGAAALAETLDMTAPTAAIFNTDHNGTATIAVQLNFDRDNQHPVNPFTLSITDVNLTDSNSIIGSSTAMNQDAHYLYARAKSTKYIYDNITANVANTPIKVEVYCDQWPASANCPGVDVINGTTNDPRWYISTSHDSPNGDGNIYPFIDADLFVARIAPAEAIINANGIANDVTVTNLSDELPYTVEVTLDDNAPTVTSSWLVFNPNDPTLFPIPFYEVRFIGNATWSGVGKTGNVVGTDANTQTTKRMDW